jgi:hypothetical protein
MKTRFEVWIILNGKRAFVFTTMAINAEHASLIARNSSREQRVSKCWPYHTGDTLEIIQQPETGFLERFGSDPAFPK